jgi:hypothetical protein
MSNPELAPNPSDITVAAVIASYMNERTGHANPSIARIAKQSRLARTTVLRAIARLEAAGLLDVAHGRGQGNHYRAATPAQDVATGPRRRSNQLPHAPPNQSHHATGRTMRPVADRSHHATRTRNEVRERQKQSSQGPGAELPFSQHLNGALTADLLERIAALQGVDADTGKTVSYYARRGLPEGAFRSALEATATASSAGAVRTTEIAYFVGTLRSYLEDGTYTP